MVPYPPKRTFESTNRGPKNNSAKILLLEHGPTPDQDAARHHFPDPRTCSRRSPRSLPSVFIGVLQENLPNCVRKLLQLQLRRGAFCDRASPQARTPADFRNCREPCPISCSEYTRGKLVGPQSTRPTKGKPLSQLERFRFHRFNLGESNSRGIVKDIWAAVIKVADTHTNAP